jgi:hypothetical protein
MTMKALLSPLAGRLLILLRDFGPYAAIELLLPGGSVVALLYWWYRHRVRRTSNAPELSRSTSRLEQNTRTGVLSQQALRTTTVRKSATTSVATVMVSVLACLSTACTTMHPVAIEAAGEQVRREVKVGDTVRVLTKAGASHSFQVTAVGESSLSGNAARLSGAGSDAVRARIEVRYPDIAQIEVQRASGLKTVGMIAGVVLVTLVGTTTGWGSHSPGFKR